MKVKKFLRLKVMLKSRHLRNYIIESEDIVLNKELNSVISEKKNTIQDNENNIISLDNFEYQKQNKIFKSIGLIEIQDKFNNIYKFSQLYIDTREKEILGSDVSAFINNQEFKIDKKNDPRIIGFNTFSSNKDKKNF